MKTIFAAATLILVLFLYMNRERVYLRDPLGAVYRNEVKQAGDWVFINYSNDVLVQSGSLQHMQQYLVQHFTRVPGAPQQMSCLLGMVCLSPEDEAPMVAWHAGTAPAVMNNRQVTFKDGDGTAIRIKIR